MKRTVIILGKKYFLYMIPALLSAAGMSLSEFADSMIVSRLLGENAMGIVNLTSPIIMICSTIYTIFGLGGSILLAESLGKKDRAGAESIYSISIIASVITITLVSVAGLSAKNVLGVVLGCPDELLYGFDRHITVLLCSIPIVCLTSVITFYFPIIGKPWAATFTLIIANVLNVSFDYIYIRVFEFDVAGAAFATLTGYSVAFVFAMIFAIKSKNVLRFRLTKPNLKLIAPIARKGMAASTVQLCYGVFTIFCNNLMNYYYSTAGIIFISLSGQLDSLVSILITGIADNNASFSAMLKGEGDYRGIRILTRSVMICLFASVSAISALFCIFTKEIAFIYNIRNPEALALIKSLLPVFVLHYPLRMICIVLRDVYNVLGREIYALSISIIDKCAGIVLFGLTLSKLFGGVGVVLAFVTNSCFVLVLIFTVNSVIIRTSGNKYSRILLIEKDCESALLYDLTFMPQKDSIVDIGINIQNALKDTEGDSIAYKTGLLLEEMVTYSEVHHTDRPIDIRINKSADGIYINFRIAGLPYNPYSWKEGDSYENRVILEMIGKPEYSYAFGINSIRFNLNR